MLSSAHRLAEIYVNCPSTRNLFLSEKEAAAAAAALETIIEDLCASENQLSSKLDRARAIESTRACNRTKITCRHWIGWIESLLNLRVGIAGAGMVEEIPGFRAELELQVLPDIEILKNGEVDIAESRPVNGISS